MEILHELTSLGEKKAGTETGIKAREFIFDYMNKKFPESGASYEKFTITSCVNNQAAIEFKDKSIKSHLYDNTGSEGNSIEGELYLAGYRLSRKDKKRVKGKIVVFHHNVLFHRIFQIISAYQSGAAGILLVSKSDDYIQKGIGFPYDLGNCKIPAVGIKIADWNSIKSSASKKIKIIYSISYEEFKCSNVIFDFNEKKSDKKIVIGAHFDSWHAGSHDNCIAVQLLVDILESIKNETSKKIRHSVRGIFFDAEELGLLGSNFHIFNNNQVDNYNFYLNLEMPVPTHAGKSKFFGYSGHKLTRKSFSKLALLNKGIFIVPLKLFYRFIPVFPADINPFYQKGIPCATTFCRNPLIHTPLDTIENIKIDQYDKIKNYLLELIYEIDKNIS